MPENHEGREWAIHRTRLARQAFRVARLDVVRADTAEAIKAVDRDLTPAGVEVYVTAADVRSSALRCQDLNYEASLVSSAAADRARAVLPWGYVRMLAETVVLQDRLANSERDGARNTIRAVHDSARALAESAQPVSSLLAFYLETLAASSARRAPGMKSARREALRAAGLHVLDTNGKEPLRVYYFGLALQALDDGDWDEAEECLRIAGHASEGHIGREVFQAFGWASLELRVGDRDAGADQLAAACDAAELAGYRRAARIGRKDLSHLT